MLGVFNIIKEIIVMGEKITKEQPSENMSQMAKVNHFLVLRMIKID